MIDLLQIVASIGGVGAVFGIVIFLLYRLDRRSSENKLREDRKFMEDRLDKVINAYNATTADNTRVLTELIIWLKAKNGNK